MQFLFVYHRTGFNPLTSVSHWSGFKVKLTFHETQFFWL